MKKDTGTWVVYLMTLRNRADKMLAVCEQNEWDAMELNCPGFHQLVREGISCNVAADLIVRGNVRNLERLLA